MYLPYSRLGVIIITVIVLQIVDSLVDQVQCIVYQNLRVGKEEKCLKESDDLHQLLNTQASKVLASCSSCPREPRIVPLQVKYLHTYVYIFQRNSQFI